MTIVSFKAGVQNHPDLLKIELSDGSVLVMKNYYLDSSGETGNFDGTDSAVAGFSLTPGQEISPEEEETFRFAAACYRIEHAGMRLVARAEQTQAGLSRKLEARFHNTACISIVVSRLVEQGFVNDERFAERWLRAKLSRKNGKISGPRGLSAALGRRGIGREAQRDAFNSILDEDAELTLLRRFIAKDRKGAMSGAYSLKGRLRYEGFSSPVINRYFEEADDENSSD